MTRNCQIQQDINKTRTCKGAKCCNQEYSLFSDMTHIRSVTRNCQIQQDMCKGAKCCNEDGVYPSCEYKYRDDRCNDNNPEEHFKLDKTDDGGTGDGNTIIPSSILMSVLYIVHVLK